MHVCVCVCVNCMLTHKRAVQATNDALATFRLVAAKSDYFGVGGSVSSFMQHVQASQHFMVEVVKHIRTGKNPPPLHTLFSASASVAVSCFW